MALALTNIFDRSRFIPQAGTRNNILNVRTAAFLLGKVCLFAAVGFAYLIGDMLRQSENDSLPTVDMTPQQDSLNQKQKVPFETYSPILNTGIFGKTKVDAKPEPKAATPSALKLRLVAINAISSGNRIAIIEDTQKQDQDVFDLNESVFNQGKLVEIGRESVKIEHGGLIDTLAMQDVVTPSAPGTAPAEAASDGQTEFSVAEDELSAALANLPQLLSQARAVPYFRNGQSIGMRLFAIRTGSMYEKLGLKNGDIVLAVNDNSLSDPAQALKLFEQLKSERSINVKLERNSQSMDMHYSIR
ncbi:MAG: type II secretion system protein N [Bdellovibrionota bacterium]